MNLVKRFARHILRDEFAEARWQAVIDADANSAYLLEAVARVMRQESKGVRISAAEDLADWEEFRR